MPIQLLEYVSCHVGYVYRMWRRSLREKVMSRQLKKKRIRELIVLVSDKTNDGLLELYEQGKITKQEYRQESTKLGCYLQNADLMPIYPAVIELKESIRQRMGVACTRLLREMQQRRTRTEAKKRMERLAKPKQ